MIFDEGETMPYKFLENIALADVAFEVTGRVLSEIFTSAGLATMAVMVKDVKSIKPKIKKEINLENESAEQLLFAFLDELIFLKDSEQLLFSKFDIKVTEVNGKFVLSGFISGEKINPDIHETLVDIKAVTMHHFSLKKTESGWRATVVLDI